MAYLAMKQKDKHQPQQQVDHGGQGRCQGDIDTKHQKDPEHGTDTGPDIVDTVDHPGVITALILVEFGPNTSNQRDLHPNH